jgi:hypothetical protein
MVKPIWMFAFYALTMLFDDIFPGMFDIMGGNDGLRRWTF